MPLSFDPVVTNSGRLRILAALARGGPEAAQQFVQLRAATRLTDGNLATHARRHASAGLVSIDKQTRAGRPVTSIHLTEQGREALRTHVEQLVEALGTSRQDDPAVKIQTAAIPVPTLRPVPSSTTWSDDWID
jgi:DNA-binding MarR family transcriptional regulator